MEAREIVRLVQAGRRESEEEAVALVEREMNALLERAYLAARGTDKLLPRFGNSQPYWKGRADAANAVRALKTK